MNLRISIPILVGLLFFAGSGFCEPQKSAKETFKSFLEAFAGADTKRMGEFYAAEVTVLRGSTILDGKYGGLGGKDGRESDKIIKREALLAAYETTIEKLGGKKPWIEKGEWLKTKETKLIPVDSKDKEESFSAIGTKVGDVLVILNPKGDAALFLLREFDGKWLIIKETWD